MSRFFSIVALSAALYFSSTGFAQNNAGSDWLSAKLKEAAFWLDMANNNMVITNSGKKIFILNSCEIVKASGSDILVEDGGIDQDFADTIEFCTKKCAKYPESSICRDWEPVDEYYCLENFLPLDCDLFPDFLDENY